MKTYKIIAFYLIKSALALAFIFLGTSCHKEKDNYSLLAPEFINNDTIFILEDNKTSVTIELKINEGYEYFYTLDNNPPDRASIRYNANTGIVLNIGDYILKVKAYNGDSESEIITKHIIISHVSPAIINGVANKTNYTHALNIDIANFNSSIEYTTLLNNKIIDISDGYAITEPNFYTLKIISKLGESQRTDSVIFVILNPDFNETEWGLRTWIPSAYTLSNFTTEAFESIYPTNFITGVNFPIIIKTTNGENIQPLYLSIQNSFNNETFNLKRGIGSQEIKFTSAVSSVSLNYGAGSLSIPINFETPVWTNLSDTIHSYYSGKNARIRIQDNVILPTNDTLYIDEGSIILIDEAININNYGFIKITGTDQNPVVITCANPSAFWGGFLSKGIGNKMEITGAIICQSGYHTSSEYNWGHAQRQALFYMNGTTFTITNSYILDHIGQIFYSLNSANITISNSLIQRAKTGGQVNASQIHVENSIFTDFPNDSYIFQDNDNDAFYISGCNATINNSTFMFAKDDGIDSGGDDGGIVNITNCWFEAMFHEGIAMSSKNPSVKEHNISNSTFTNCGQGIELGFSSPNHTVNVENCMIYKNGIGLRYGDNYDWSIVAGWVNVSNTYSINNIDYDIWNMVRQYWAPKLNHMSFTNTHLSMFSEQYPGLIVDK
jgi:hypothetical protein